MSSLVLGAIAAAAVVYLGFKVRQDRERLRRIVGIIDAEHQFDFPYLCQLADSGQLVPHGETANPEPVRRASRRR